MTRASNEALRRTGARNTRAIWLILTSSSDTVHLTQQLAQAFAGAHYPHLERRNPDACELRHLVVAQLLYILQQEGFALVGPQLLQSAIDFFAPRGSLGRMILRRTEQRRLVRHERPRPSPPSRPDGPAPVDQDAEQPGPESFGILALRQRSVRPRERVLQRLFRVLAVAEHVKRVAGIPVAIPLDQCPERLHIAAQHVGYDDCVRASFHVE